MCGIAGVATPGRTPDRALVEAMAATLVHRGPDDAGAHIGEDVGLGFRRLAIIDLETGNQPSSSEDGSIVAVFNGEIYNYRELRERLAARGHRFRGRGDAEVLPHLYEEHGADLVHELRGMFALAIWDGRTRELLLARDRLGEKPLYWSDALPGGGLAFGSELKALLAAGIAREPDHRALAQYLFQLYVPAPRSALRDARKLAPGHLLRWRDGRAEVERYWAPSMTPAQRTEAEHVAGLRERVLDAVRSRLVADVPLGAFLSGGIDSATVVAGMRAAHDGPVHTFTITFEGDEQYDESAQARATAQHFGTEHHELRATLNAAEGLTAIVEHFDEPFGNPTALLVRSLSEATREQVKVVLTGDGADELFFGYPRFRGLALAQRYRRAVPSPLRGAAARASALLPESTTGRHALRRAREFLAAGTLDPAAAYGSWIGYFTADLRAELLDGGPLGAETAHAEDFLRGLPEPGRELDLQELSRIELLSFLPNNVLEYADRMSMACGLEMRAPFVDHELVEYVGTIPAGLKLRGSTTKWALREAMGPELPPALLHGRKRGLNPPLGRWLAGDAAPLVDELLSDDAVRRRGLVRPEAVRRLRAEQARGWRDRSLHIWALAVLELWFRLRVDA